MPAFKPQASHRSCLGIKEYLLYGKGKAYKENKALGKSRVRGFWAENIADFDTWDRQMDMTRRLYGNDRAWKGRKARTFNHFVLSPDPADQLSCNGVLDYAKAYAVHWFGNGDVAGVLGQYEYVVIIHDDNEGHIPHAHVVVNNTDLDSGRRLQISDKDNRAMRHFANELAAARGLHYFNSDYDTHESLTSNERAAGTELRDRAYVRPPRCPKDVAEPTVDGHPAPRPTSTKDNRTFAERAAEKALGASWKEDIRARVKIAYETSKSLPQFVANCNRLGLTIDKSTSKSRSGEFIYAYAEEPTRRVGAWNLGGQYCLRSLYYHYQKDKAVSTHKQPPARVDDVMRAFGTKAFKVGYITGKYQATLADVASAYSELNSLKVSSQAALEALIVSAKDKPEIASHLSALLDFAKHTYMLPVSELSRPVKSAQGNQAQKSQTVANKPVGSDPRKLSAWLLEQQRRHGSGIAAENIDLNAGAKGASGHMPQKAQRVDTGQKAMAAPVKQQNRTRSPGR